jgi:putative membrane protein (TIGR04086 family)
MYKDVACGNGLFSILKSVLAALAISFLLSVVFAVIIEMGCVKEPWIYAVTQTIKAVSIAAGVLLFTRGEKGWLKGGGAGLLFTALSYLAFSSLGGDFSLGWLIIVELILALLIGGISGIIAVNLKK